MVKWNEWQQCYNRGTGNTLYILSIKGSFTTHERCDKSKTVTNYGRHQSNYINIHFKCEGSKYINKRQGL